MNQSVPASAPAGQYYYYLHAGDYPEVAVSSDSFAFTKLGSGTQDSGFGDWTLTGWEDEIGGTRFVTSEPGDMTEHVPPNVFPNPFNPSTTISYELRAASYVSLRVYDTAGRFVTELLNGWRKAGRHQAIFDGSGWPSGVYLIKLESGGEVEVKKAVLLK